MEAGDVHHRPEQSAREWGFSGECSQPTDDVLDFYADEIMQETPVGSPVSDVPMPLVTAPIVAKSFRINAMNIFCTWPQCDEDKGTVLARIMAWRNVEWAVVCKEDHHETDGTHLHAIIHLTKRCNIHSSAILDAFAGKPGHYETAKNLKQSTQYIIKDGDWVANGIDVPKFLKEKKSAKSAVIAEMIKADVPIAEIMDKESGFYLLHSRQIRQFKAEWTAMKEAKTLTGYIVVKQWGMTAAETEIGCWLNGNMQAGQIRPLGRPQLFVYGPTAVGKSHMCEQLARMVKTYFATSCEKFFDGLDDSYDLLVLDEFHSQHTITFLNQLLDGQRMVIPQKGSQFHKQRNIPIIMCSNYSPQECFAKVYEEHRDHYDAFVRRLKVVHITARIDLWPQPHLQRQNAFVL